MTITLGLCLQVGHASNTAGNTTPVGDLLSESRSGSGISMSYQTVAT